MKNLIGQTFGFLKALSLSNKKQHLDCLCVCGKLHTVREDHLKDGSTKSCGCKKNAPLISVGDVFGRLTVIECLPKRKDYKTYKGGNWLLCKCTCGVIKSVFAACLRKGQTTSCGCYAKELSRELGNKYGKQAVERGNIIPGNLLSKTHGEAGVAIYLRTVEYGSWASMISACFSIRDTGYKYVGAKGIKVCASWLSENDGYQQFLVDRGRKPSKNHVLMRIDINKDYTPENTKWGLRKESVLNNRWHLEHADEIAQIPNYYDMSPSLRQYYRKKIQKQKEAEKNALPAPQRRILSRFQSQGL